MYLVKEAQRPSKMGRNVSLCAVETNPTVFKWVLWVLSKHFCIHRSETSSDTQVTDSVAWCSGDAHTLDTV